MQAGPRLLKASLREKAQNRQVRLHHETDLTLSGYITVRIKPSLYEKTVKIEKQLAGLKHKYKAENGINGFAATLPMSDRVRWQTRVATFSTMNSPMKRMSINGFLNERPWRKDTTVYRVDGHWATPCELVANGGDCEDFAIAKYLLLQDLGWPKDSLWLLLGETTNKTPNEWHALVAVKHENKFLYLDNTRHHTGN